jgi:hypothetical protein
VRLDPARTQVREELLRRGRRRRLRPGPPDVNPGVVVGAGDADAAVGVDVDRGRQVELRRARAVADLPDGEELGEAAPMASGERGGDGVERMGQRARDLLVVEVLGDRRDVAGQLEQPRVIVRRDAVAEDVDLVGLAGEAGSQLLGHERVGPVGDLHRPRDRVVVGDGHEVHPAPLRELVDLLRGRRALRKAERTLYAEPGDLRGGRVDVQVRSRIGHASEDLLDFQRFRDNWGIRP